MSVTPVVAQLTKPLRILIGPVEVVADLVALEFSILSSWCGFCEKRCNLGGGHWLETARGIESLMQDVHRITAGDYDAGGQIHRIVQAFDRRSRFAFQDDLVAHWLHAENADLMLDEHRQNLFLEAVKVGVHYVQRHLDGVKGEIVCERGVKHLQVDVGTLVSSESDVADLSLLLRFEDGLHAAAFREDAVGIGVADDLVKLEKIDVIGLEAAQGFL